MSYEIGSNAHFYQCGLTLISVQLALHLFLILKTKKDEELIEIKVKLH